MYSSGASPPRAEWGRVAPPGPWSVPRVSEGREPARLQALVPNTLIEGFDVTVLSRPTGLREVKLDSLFVGPAVAVVGRELRPVVETKPLRLAALHDLPIEDPRHVRSSERTRSFAHEALARHRVDHVRDPKAPAILEAIVHEAEALLLIRPRRLLRSQTTLGRAFFRRFARTMSRSS